MFLHTESGYVRTTKYGQPVTLQHAAQLMRGGRRRKRLTVEKQLKELAPHAAAGS